MARTDSFYSSTDATLINLTNLVSRLEGNLLSSSEYQQQLLDSEFQRDRVAANIEYGRTLLLQLERSLPNIKSQSRKNALHADLAQKRQQITALKLCLDGIAIRSATQYTVGDDEASSGNDIFIYTPEESASGEQSPQPRSVRDTSELARETETNVDDIVASRPTVEEETPSTSTASQHPSATPITAPSVPTTAPEPSTTLRNRIRNSSISIPSTTTITTGTSQPTPAAASGSSTSKLQATESALSHSRSEQETLTESLLTLASQLKSSSQSFQSSLESERGIIDRAVQGLDRNITGMDAAGRRMGMLRRMTEGKGWWGRMLMYAWIFALWVVAMLIVCLGPKLRF